LRDAWGGSFDTKPSLQLPTVNGIVAARKTV
jgi:hypothetical protein